VAGLLAAGSFAGPVVQAQSVLFEEDFDDGVADGFTPIGPGWEVPGGTYNCETTGFEIYSSSVFGDPLWGDVSIAFDIKSIDSVNHLLRFRVNDFEDYYVLNLRSKPWHDVRFERVLNTVHETIAVGAVGFNNGIWHHVEVVLEGYQIEVYLNGYLALTAHDDQMPDRLRTGQCAVVSYSGGVMQHQDVSYDNIVVVDGVVAVEQWTLSSVKALFQ
jgi:hypothetical protein